MRFTAVSADRSLAILSASRPAELASPSQPACQHGGEMRMMPGSLVRPWMSPGPAASKAYAQRVRDSMMLAELRGFTPMYCASMRMDIGPLQGRSHARVAALHSPPRVTAACRMSSS